MLEDNEVEKIKNEISTKIRLPQSEKNKIYLKMFYNLLLAFAVLIYFIFLDLGYLKLETEVFKTDLKVFAIILLGFTIYFIEKSCKTSRKTYAVHAVELLVLSLITLYMPYVYFYHNSIAQFIFSTSSIYLGVYYIIKCICMYIIYKRRYIHSMSDINKIVQDEKESYLEEESTKIVEQYVEAKNKQILERENNKKEMIKKEFKKKQKSIKEEQDKKIKDSEKKEITKTNKAKKATKNKKVPETKNEEEKPKRKRGRPRKNKVEESVEKND